MVGALPSTPTTSNVPGMHGNAQHNTTTPTRLNAGCGAPMVPTDGTRRHSYGLRFLDSTVFVRARLIEQICRMDIYRRAQCDEHGRQLGLLCGVRRRACGSWQAVRCSLANTRSLLLWTQFRRPRLLPDAINLAISGHHFRKICEKHVV